MATGKILLNITGSVPNDAHNARDKKQNLKQNIQFVQGGCST